MNPQSVSVVIPTLNEEVYLPRLLESLKGIQMPIDVIVVDGASEDDTPGVVARYMHQFNGAASLALIRSEKRGISLQRNLGAAKAKYDILMFCDADIIFSPTSLFEKIVTEFVQRKLVVAAPLLRSIEPGFQPRLCYQVATLLQRFLLVFRRPYFAGSCLLTTKEVFQKTGGFDTNIPLAEDVDYSLRAVKFGRAGLLNVKLPVSARRIIKYGYGWLFSEIPNVFRLLFTGRLKSETIYYPFGEYGGQKAHHVTQNTGK